MKKGVTLLVVILAISIMLILISTASVIGSKSIITANFEEYNLVLQRVSDEVNEYYVENNELPVKVETVSVEAYQEFYNYLSKYTNDTGSKFYIVDIVNIIIFYNKNTSKTADFIFNLTVLEVLC